MLLFSCLLVCMGILARAAGETTEIINDTFSGAKGVSIANRTPDKANVPGGKWSVMGFSMGGGFAGILNGAGANLVCSGNSTGAIAIPLSGPGASAKPQRFSIVADLRGANPGLGFYSVLVKQDAFNGLDVFSNFTGLLLGGNGSLSLYRKGGLVSTVKYTGTFDSKQFHKLSYDVDTGSGAISNVSLQGSTSDYSSFSVPGVFTDEATTYVALAALCEGGRDNQAFAQNLLVTGLPPAATPAPAPVAEKPADASSPILIKNGDRIGYMGDSITALGNSRKGYVQLVITGLKAEGVDAAAVPAGHSGDTSANMLLRVNPDVLHRGANWMTLSCGVNDVHLSPGVGLEAYKKNVETMVAKAQSWNVRVVILTATPIGEDANSPNNQKLAAYNEFLRSFAAEKKLPLADMNAAFWKVLNSPPDAGGFAPGKRLLADGLHPNDTGQFLMAVTLLEALGVPATDMPQVQKAMEEAAKG